MSAAVAHRSVANMPRAASRNSVRKSEDKKRDSPLKEAIKPEPTPPDADPPAKPPEVTDDADRKPVPSNAESTGPLAPPPRPNNQSVNGEPPDYFSGQHGTQYSSEPNLFEQSFGNIKSNANGATNHKINGQDPAATTAVETPGKLPSIASLASPAPQTGNGLASAFPNWPGSLRSGPLSPAMLSGPATGTGAGPGGDSYFDNLRPFPTPNESSLRTGLTPGGTGSMFPPAAPSPNTQAFLNTLASGGATPSTLEFHRTAAVAAAQQKVDQASNYTNGQTNQAPAASRAPTTTMDAAPQTRTAVAPAPAPNVNFGQHDSDAANGLFLLAQAGNESASQSSSFPPANHVDRQPTHVASSINGAQASDAGDLSDADTGKGPRKSKRSTAGKGGQRARKAEETTPSAKAPASKKSKSNSGVAASIQQSPEMMDDSDMDMDMDDGMNGKSGESNGRKMTDDEKRKNFLERNRVAALKCRQRKKQWLQNLQQKVELFSTENDALTAQVAGLREEVLNLKTLLIAHKDCPIAQQQHAQGLSGYLHGATGHEGYGGHAGAGGYGMAMGGQQQVMTGPRRYS